MEVTGATALGGRGGRFSGIGIWPGFFLLFPVSPLAPCTLLCPDRSSGAAHIVAPKGLALHRGNLATSWQTSKRELKKL